MALYSNQELISLLENTKAKQPYMGGNSTYEYLAPISQDLTSLDAKLNLMDIFGNFELQAYPVLFEFNDRKIWFDLGYF